MDLFFAIFLKDILVKETSFFEQGKILDLVKVCFVFAFEKHAITIKNTIQPHLKKLRKKGKIQLEPERLSIIASATSNF